MLKRLAVIVVLVLGVVTMNVQQVHGAPTPTLNQTITAGTLTTDILDASRVPVASPSAAFTSKAFSFDCQTGGAASTGTLGTNTEREYVINPGGANNGFTLAIAATAGATALWTAGGNTFDFNDANTAGCGDTTSSEPDTKSGQMTINPSVSTLTTDCTSCTVTSITKGSSTAFVEGSANSVNLLTAAAGSDDNWRGYLTGTALSQTIPAETPAGAYALPMTITVTAS